MPVKSTAVTVHYFAEDVSAGGGKTGDAANHTLRRVSDGTPATITASPAEVDSTNLPGVYRVALTGAENAGAVMLVGGKSSTANVVLRPVQWTNEVNVRGWLDTAPVAPNVAGIPKVDVVYVLGSAVTASGGTVDANVVSISGDTVAADNAESFFDGTGYAGTNNVIPTVTTITGLAGTITSALGVTVGLDSQFNNVPGAVWSNGTRTITGGTITTYTGNTPQTGDAYARLGAPAGASTAADVAGILAEVQKVPRTGTTHTHTNTGTSAAATVAIT